MGIELVDIGLEGTVLTAQELEQAKRGNTTIRRDVRDAVLWHQAIPTTGLLETTPYFPPHYPYLPHQFTLWELAPNKGRGVSIGIIDTAIGPNPDLMFAYQTINLVPKIEGSVTTAGEPKLSHGSHTMGIISGIDDGGENRSPSQDTGISGLAPNATITLLNAFENGKSSKNMLTRALEEAHRQNIDIVNMGLKIAESINLDDQSTKELERAIGHIPYTVTAAGNSGTSHLSYPAKFPCVTFDVGAFKYKDNAYPIFEVSQHEEGIGPLFVAPGYNILSSGYPDNDQATYVFMGGTSTAAPIMTGFVALMLGEFKDTFTKPQLLAVVYTSGFFMHDTQSWKSHSLLGTLDMRTALFVLHCLNYIRDHYPDVDFADKAQFETAVAILHDMLLQPIGGQAAKQNFAVFLNQNAHQSPHPTNLNLSQVVASVAHKAYQKLGGVKNQKNSTLFSHLPQYTQQRIEKKLKCSSES